MIKTSDAKYVSNGGKKVYYRKKQGKRDKKY